MRSCRPPGLLAVVDTHPVSKTGIATIRGLTVRARSYAACDAAVLHRLRRSIPRRVRVLRDQICPCPGAVGPTMLPGSLVSSVPIAPGRRCSSRCSRRSRCRRGSRRPTVGSAIGQEIARRRSRFAAARIADFSVQLSCRCRWQREAGPVAVHVRVRHGCPCRRPFVAMRLEVVVHRPAGVDAGLVVVVDPLSESPTASGSRWRCRRPPRAVAVARTPCSVRPTSWPKNIGSGLPRAWLR